MTDDIEFGELPPRGPAEPNQRYQQIAEKLRANPGQWARIATAKNHSSASSTAFHIRHGKTLAFQPAGAFEATTRGEDVWARYVGDKP